MESKRTSRIHQMNLVAILASCALFAWLRWGKLNSLVHDDPAMWLFQVSRAARGEVPYADFTWNYPPFSIWVTGGFLHLFGVTFPNAQMVVDLFSVVIVLLSYWVVRRMLPALLHFPVILLLIMVGATAQTKFTLFSFLTYSPSLHTATIGLLLILIGALRYFESDNSPLTFALIASGSFVSITSKPESALAAIAVLVCISWFRLRIGLLATAILPAVAAYAWEIALVGGANLKEGVSGYGLATLACPWWPTGLGVYGMLASFSQAVLIAALASLPLRRARRRWLSIAAIPCGVIYLSYYAYLSQEELTSSHAMLYKMKQVLPLLFWTSPVLLPAMWVGIVYCLVLGYRLMRRRTADHSMFLVLVVPVVMSVRSLFGTTLYPYTEVSALCYAFFLLVGPILLYRFLTSRGGSAFGPGLITGSVCLAYCAIRLAGGYGPFLSNSDYTILQTDAGPVKIHGDDGSAAIYRYVVDNTRPEDYVLDIPYGGGINLAANRRSPAFTVQFEQLRPSELHQRRDLEQVRAHRPKVILVDDKPGYGFMYGWTHNISCPCPRFVWQPDSLAGDPAHTFPLNEFIRDRYKVDRKIGTKLVLIPK